MADGKVTIAVDLDGKKAQGDINSLKASLSGLGSTFKSVLGANLVSGALMSGVNALAGGVKGAFSSAISEGAKLQQSIGGIETLFKGSAGTVKKYAESAFKTAGISANEYMENVTSFSASLIQSLGGDTAAAAELANTALMDMSDNANKMGSDMGMVTQTYQSLARGNYQMLDNLKLGYGGTKAELQRLIKDSASYKDIQEELNMTVDEGDMSFANIVKAISVMQKKLDITGTTAKEASETFTGSFASMKAAFKDFLGNLTTGGDIKKPLENLAKTAATFVFKNAVPMIANAFKALPKAISTFLASSKPEIEAGLKKMLPESTVNNIMKTFDNIGKFFSGFKDTGALTAVADAFGAVKDAIGHVFSSLAGNEATFSNIGRALGEIVKFLADAAKKGAEFISSLPPETIKTIAGAVAGAVVAFKGFKTVTGIIKGVTGAFNLLKAALSANPFMMAVVAIGALVGAFITAYNTSETFRAKVDGVVKAVKKFLDGLDPEKLKSWGATIGAIAGGFAVFKMLNGWNPFKAFGKNGKEALDATGDAIEKTGGRARKSKGIITQIFTGLGNSIKSLGQGISTAAKGIGQGVGSAFRGIGQGLARVNPATIVALSVPILALGAAFALMGTQGQGIATILQGVGTVIVSIGTAIGTILNLALQGLANALVIIAPVLPTIATAFANMSPLVLAFGTAISTIITSISTLAPVITAMGGAISSVITAIGGAVAQISEAITPIIQILADAFTTVAPIVADAIVRIVQALAPAMPAISQMVSAISAALPKIADAFAKVVAQISPIIDSITGLIKGLGETISSVFNSAKGVIDSIGGAIKGVLDGLANVFKSIGTAAKDAGTGFKSMAQGVKMISDVGIIRTGSILAAVAAGMVAVGGAAASFGSAGTEMKKFGQGLSDIANYGTLASSAMGTIGTAFTTLASHVQNLPVQLSTLSTAMKSFATSIVASLAGLLGANASVNAFKGQLTALNASMMMAMAGAKMMSSGFSTLNSILTTFGGVLGTIPSRLIAITTASNGAKVSIMQLAASAPMVASGFANISSVATSAMSRLNSAVRSAMTRAVLIMRLSMLQMVNVVRQSASQMTQAGRQAGKGVSNGVVNGIRGGIGSARAAMSAMVNAIRSTGMSGVGSMRGIGAMIGQGLAQGMYSSLGAVTAAANALVAQAERAARAKAQIHSPSRLFRDSVGRFLPMGVAVGIEKGTKYVDKAIGGMYDNIQAFSYKAEDIIGVGKTKLSKVVQVKSDFENAIKAKVEVAKEKSNDLMEKALDIAEKAVERPSELVLDDGTLVAKTGDKYDKHQTEQARRRNRMRGIVT